MKKSKSKSRRDAARAARSGVGAFGIFNFAFCIFNCVGVAHAAAEPDNSVFEGGTNTYNNWIEFSAGGLIPSGNRSQAEQDRHQSKGRLAAFRTSTSSRAWRRTRFLPWMAVAFSTPTIMG